MQDDASSNTTFAPQVWAGKNANFVSGSGNTTTGYSGYQLAASGVATTSTLDLKIIRPLNSADNLIGVTVNTNMNAKWLVKLNNYEYANQTADHLREGWCHGRYYHRRTPESSLARHQRMVGPVATPSARRNGPISSTSETSGLAAKERRGNLRLRARPDSKTTGLRARLTIPKSRLRSCASTHVATLLGYIVTFEELRDDLYEVVSKSA